MALSLIGVKRCRYPSLSPKHFQPRNHHDHPCVSVFRKAAANHNALLALSVQSKIITPQGASLNNPVETTQTKLQGNIRQCTLTAVMQ